MRRKISSHIAGKSQLEQRINERLSQQPTEMLYSCL